MSAAAPPPAVGSPASTPEDEPPVLRNFIRRVLRRGDISYVTLLLAVLYLQRLRDVRRRWPREGFSLVAGDHSGCAEFLTALMLADKYLYDTAFANQFWAGANGRYTLEDLNGFERRLLDWLEYDLFVSDAAFRDFIGYLEVTVVLRRVAGRGAGAALSYTDLTAMSTTLPARYARELRLTLPPASALVFLGKVLLGAAAVYSSIVLCLVVVASLSPRGPASPAAVGVLRPWAFEAAADAAPRLLYEAEDGGLPDVGLASTCHGGAEHGELCDRIVDQRIREQGREARIMEQGREARIREQGREAR